MDGSRNVIGSVSHFLHRYFIWFLMASYALAAVLPGPALRIRSVTFGDIVFLQETTTVSLPMVMLALLLLNAGLGVQTSELRHLLRQPRILAGGLAANLLVPITFIFGVAQAMRFWHNPDEVQHILVGLSMVAAMPIAGSSTAWTQNANGSVSLSLALVLCSTLLSPLTTPITFDLADHIAEGEYAQALDQLEHSGTGFLLGGCVLAPSLLGIALRFLIGDARASAVRPTLKLVNSLNLLLLNYSNAAVSLPHVVAEPDWDFLAVVLVIVTLLCVTAFGAGWLLAHVLKADPAQRISLMFGLGMNNNGAGLVLAALTLARYPGVLLPIIFYNLVQHLVAGFVDAVWCRKWAASAADHNDNPNR